jgi:hypothetical protein
MESAIDDLLISLVQSIMGSRAKNEVTKSTGENIAGCYVCKNKFQVVYFRKYSF